MIKVGRNILLPCSINSRQLDYTDYKAVSKLNLDNGEKTYIHSLPSIYNEKFWGVDFKYQVGFAYNERQGQLTLNYPMTHELFIGDTNSNILKSRHVGSNHIKEIPFWSDDLSIGLSRPSAEDYGQITNFRFSSSDYISIKYDPYRRLYYRITHIRPSVEDIQLGSRTPDISIIILTEDLEKVGEVFLENEMYSHTMFFVSREGFNIVRNDVQMQNEDFMPFEILISKRNP